MYDGPEGGAIGFFVTPNASSLGLPRGKHIPCENLLNSNFSPSLFPPEAHSKRCGVDEVSILAPNQKAGMPDWLDVMIRDGHVIAVREFEGTM